MKLLLIQPSHLGNNGRPVSLKFCFLSSLTLPYLAALTPSDIEVEIRNDYFHPIDFDASADLIAITVQTHQAPRAYQIADEFRRRGKKVVMGGFHPTFHPKESLTQADTVVTGEAERVWPIVLRDFQKGHLQRLYSGPLLSELKDLPTPRYDLLAPSPVIFTPVQATRGCLFHCDFCYVTKFFKNTFRQRPISEVIRDVEAAAKTGPFSPLLKQTIFFVDDNLTAQRKYARELFIALTPLKIQWASQCDITVAYDQDFLDLARESGCILFYMGLESFNQKNLDESGKGFLKAAQFPELLSRIRRAGIGVHASMIFGFDHDSHYSLTSTVSRLVSSKVVAGSFYIYMPATLSRTETNLKKEQRFPLKDKDGDTVKRWSMYDGGHASFYPKNFSPKELEDAFWNIYKNFYSIRSIFKRIIPLFFARVFLNRKGFFIGIVFFNVLGRIRIARRLQPMVG